MFDNRWVEKYRPQDLQSLILSEYNRSIDDSKKNVFLFDLEKDPKEEQNIATEKPDIVNEYENFLKNYLFQTKNEEEFDKSQTKIIEDELKRLGYIN